MHIRYSKKLRDWERREKINGDKGENKRRLVEREKSSIDIYTYVEWEDN